MKFAPYSFSKLSSHKQCPRKFKYNYIDKVKPEDRDITALLKGGAVHSILENYPNESTHKLAPKYQHIADKFIETHLGKKYLSQESIREFAFGLNAKLEPTEYKDKDNIMRGYVDFICVIDDTLHLIDWKTGKYKDPKWQQYDQLMFYGIYFFQRYQNIQKIKISYVYVEHENHENYIILDRKYLDTYVSSLYELINAVEDDTDFPKNQTRLCDWCPYAHHCSLDT